MTYTEAKRFINLSKVSAASWTNDDHHFIEKLKKKHSKDKLKEIRARYK